MPQINVLRYNDLGFPRHELCGLFASLRECSKHRFEAPFRSTYRMFNSEDLQAEN